MTPSATKVKPTAPVDADACCAPVMQAPLDEADAEELANAFKVLADPVRLRLLSLIAARDGETCACELVGVLDRSQPTISHHLAVLHDAGLLSREKRGRWVWYRTVPTRIEALRDSLAPR
jgi:ArsR family transcriptional regulator, arsenate/arsenite/antimonite-responsive transcriptional repressor